MEQTISTISDICGIVALFLGIYAASGVYKLKKGNNKVTVSDTKIGRDFVGRDKNRN